MENISIGDRRCGEETLTHDYENNMLKKKQVFGEHITLSKGRLS